MHDLVIRGGDVVDGTGRPAFRADVAVDGDRIVAVGEVRERGWRTLDASGRLVTPGFVDPHTHLDAQLFWDPLASPCCWHGVTSVIFGNCGVGFAPVRSGDEERLARTLESVEQIPAESILAGVPFGWKSYAGYLEALAARPLGVNAAGLVGHAALRQHAMGDVASEEERRPSDAELATMRRELAGALSAGARGFSTSRTASHPTPEGVPIPGTYAAERELFALADTLRESGRGLVQWVSGFGERDHGPDFPGAVAEVRRIAETSRRAGCSLVLSLFTHELVPTLHRVVLAAVERERAGSAAIRPMFNPRPVLSLLGLANRSPLRTGSWKALYERPARERLAALEDEGLRRALCAPRPEAEGRAGGSLYAFGPERCEYELRPERRLDAVARARGERPSETVVGLFRETRGRQIFASVDSNQRADAIEEVFLHPGMLVGLGDAGAHVTGICDASMTTYVLATWARDRGRIPLEEAVRRLSSEPARLFGLEGRGAIAPGAFADLNVIDLAALEPDLPEFVCDLPAGAGRWTQRARGYAYTLVNGLVAIEDGRHTGRLAGRVLRSRRGSQRAAPAPSAEGPREPRGAGQVVEGEGPPHPGHRGVEAVGEAVGERQAQCPVARRRREEGRRRVSGAAVGSAEREVRLEEGLGDGEAEQEGQQGRDGGRVVDEDPRELDPPQRAHAAEEDGDEQCQTQRAPARSRGSARVAGAERLADERRGRDAEPRSGDPREGEQADPDGVRGDRLRAVVGEHPEVGQESEVHRQALADAGEREAHHAGQLRAGGAEVRGVDRSGRADGCAGADRREEREAHDLCDGGRDPGANELEAGEAQGPEDQQRVEHDLHERDGERDQHRRARAPVRTQPALEHHRGGEQQRGAEQQPEVGDRELDHGRRGAERTEQRSRRRRDDGADQGRRRRCGCDRGGQ
jgi:N-acyl-D-amino-acid deacylase